MAKSIRSFPKSQQESVAKHRLQAGENSGLSYYAAQAYFAGGKAKGNKKEEDAE